MLKKVTLLKFLIFLLFIIKGGCNNNTPELAMETPIITLDVSQNSNFIDLSKNDQISFSWTVTGKIEGGCTFLLGLEDNLSDAIPFITKNNMIEISCEVLDATLEIMGIKPSIEQKLCWSVEPTNQKEKKQIETPVPISIVMKRMDVKITHNGPKAIFMGNSITEIWEQRSFFRDNGYVGKGIGGQVTAQMLQRFEKDVIKLDPYCVIIMGGTNDLAHNEQYAPTPQAIINNIASMAEMAKSHKIKVLLCTVTPAIFYPWNEAVGNPSSDIIYLNMLIKNFAHQNGMTYVDYHSLLKDKDNGLKIEYMADGVDPVHLSQKAYEIIEPVIKNAIERVVY